MFDASTHLVPWPPRHCIGLAWTGVSILSLLHLIPWLLLMAVLTNPWVCLPIFHCIPLPTKSVICCVTVNHLQLWVGFSFAPCIPLDSHTGRLGGFSAPLNLSSPGPLYSKLSIFWWCSWLLVCPPLGFATQSPPDLLENLVFACYLP